MRHLQELRAGFTYKCTLCGAMWFRPQVHVKCFAKANQKILFHRDSGARGAQAQTMLDEYKKKKNCLMTGQSCPGLLCCLPQSVHCQIHHLQDISLPWKPAIHPRGNPPAVDFTQKGRCTEEPLEEPDWDHDPVDIKLFSPEEEKTISAGLDQSWPGVSFPTSERLRLLAPVKKKT